MRALFIAALSAFAFTLAAPAFAQMGGGGGMTSSGPAAPDSGAYDRGIVAYQANNYADAVRHLRNARRPAPYHGGVNYTLGLAYLGLGDKEQARESFGRAVRDRTAPPAAWLQLGTLALEAGDRDAAVTQQTALERQLRSCTSSCDAQRRTNLQSAYDQLTRLLATP